MSLRSHLDNCLGFFCSAYLELDLSPITAQTVGVQGVFKSKMELCKTRPKGAESGERLQPFVNPSKGSGWFRRLIISHLSFWFAVSPGEDIFNYVERRI